MKHGIICTLPKEKYGYFGWPSIARQADGTINVVSSGFRSTHVCPWGRTVICKSQDDGETWSYPKVINNTPIDDRDAGVISLGGQRLALTWFTSNTYLLLHRKESLEREKASGTKTWDGVKWVYAAKEVDMVLDSWTDDIVEQNLGSWIRISPEGEYWGKPMRCPVNTPHGFIVLKDGTWMYFGKKFDVVGKGLDANYGGDRPICAAVSSDEGQNWTILGSVPCPEGVRNDMCHEPHVVELKDGTLLGAVRVHNPFSTMITRSVDGGKTWSVLESIGANGAPPHLLAHSSGAVVCVYGYREKPFGQRAKVSRDQGRTWSEEIILRDDGPTLDLGYPASIELPGGDILTIYYQQLRANEPCSLLWTRWSLD